MQNFLDNFTHLEVHSYYTLLGGTASVPDLVNRAVEDHLPALALTDTNALYGVVQFSKECLKNNVQPIIGMAIDIAALPGLLPLEETMTGRLVLLADGVEGYRSLCRLSSYMQSDKNLLRGGLSWELLKNNNRGLLCLTGGRLGWIERLFRAGQAKQAARFTAQLGGLFEDRCYLSICPQGSKDNISHEIVGLGQRFGLPAAAVQPVFCLHPQERARFRLLAAIDHNCRLDEVDNNLLPDLGDASSPIYWPDKEEMISRYEDYPNAVSSVSEIIDRCGPAIPDGRPIWPVLHLPEKQSPENALRALVARGLEEKYGSNRQNKIDQRLQEELTIIINRGFAPLFLIVADIVRFARQEFIPVSTRGSVANSLVAFCAGITQVDPIKNNLLFERFLNPERTSLPDIDLDFCSRRRDEVLDYVRAAYGEDQVALVSTMNTLQPRSALRETAKALGLDEDGIKKLAVKIPGRWHPDPQRRGKWEIDEVLAGLGNDQDRAVLQAAFDIIGQPHHVSIHPGGVVITPGPLNDTLPVQLAPKGFLVTQFDHHDVEIIGLPKLDLLGIRALTVLTDVEGLVRQNHDPHFELVNIQLNDKMTADLLSSGETIGVFQCESNGARRTLRKLKAKDIADLAVANAFFKPGPATGGMAQSFVRRYRGEEKVRYLHPALEPILQPTMGVLLFQEQILRIAREIAGLSWAQADRLRKGMSKFQPREMDALTIDFLTGCQKPPPEGPGLSLKQAETLWNQVKAFAGYGFNQGHATAYADVSYRSAFTKAHFPAEFFCARLADHGGFHHPAIYMAEAKRLGISVFPPHVNFSSKRFSLLPKQMARTYKSLPVQDILWMGLGQVRDLRQRSISAIIMARKIRLFENLADLLTRVSLQRKEINHLIQCGALDGLGESRLALLAEAEQIARAGSGRQLAFAFVQQEEVPQESPLERWHWELDLLGIPLTVLPGEIFESSLPVLPFYKLPININKQVYILGVRLPGWTGDKGFFFSDGKDYIQVNPPQNSGLVDQKSRRTNRRITPWKPILVKGRWLSDDWTGEWLQADEMTPLKD